MHSPPLTLLMTVYNGLPYLPEAIESILNQTFGEFEFLIIDDGSVDDTPIVLQKYAAQDSRIRVLTNDKNRGRAFSSARGVAAANTPLVARLDADDLALPFRFERQVAYLEAHSDVDILGGWSTQIDENDQDVATQKMPTEPDKIRQLMWTNPIIHTTVMFRREAILSVGSYNSSMRYLEDYELWFRCAEAGLRFANLPTPLSRYRLTQQQFRKRKTWRWRRTHLQVGLSGCRKISAPPIAYFGVLWPIIKSILPKQFGVKITQLQRRFDPRDMSSKQETQ